MNKHPSVLTCIGKSNFSFNNNEETQDFSHEVILRELLMMKYFNFSGLECKY